MFTKILIANRGEIACRIMKTAQRLGIHCIAIYSNEDCNALHVKLADEAYCVGPAEARLSYLNQAAILAIAKQSGAEAIHPGYGFLSENADFAEACELQNIVFIGAPSAAIRAMGSKIGAKQLMQAAGVPLLPGYHGGEQQPDLLLQEAHKIGFPLLIKASAGGGGKGMRIVTAAEHFLEALASCQREAKTAFGSDDVLLEKYLTAPRHIEIQIFADRHGNCVHLFERDCSIQRRHQKVVEEAPAPHLSAEIRARMGEAAIKAAQSVHYVGAGTIEFLYDQGQFYFMEMNTRLQVEHPVTEAITGQDLVAWQLSVAYGLALPLQQAQLTLRGHAIEVRIYAEDPDGGFLPSTGTLKALALPTLTSQVRLDTGMQVGDRIGIFYDPMLAKLICFSDRREAAVQLMQQALSQLLIVGVKTNNQFLSRVLGLTTYRNGELTTDFIDKNHAALLPTLQADAALPAAVILFAAAFELSRLPAHHSPLSAEPWQAFSGWQNALTTTHRWPYEWQAQPLTINAQADANTWHIESECALAYTLHAWQASESQWRIRFSNTQASMPTEQTAQATLCMVDTHLHILYQHQQYSLQRTPRFASQEATATAANLLLAPMPGRIIAQLCEPEALIEQDQALLIMEAMKMEHTIRAPHAGKLRAYLCNVGAIVNEGDLLVDFE